MTRKMVNRMICRQTGGEVWGIIGMSSRIVSRQGNENRILLARTPGGTTDVSVLSVPN